MSESGPSGCGSSSSKNNNKKPDKPINEQIEEFNRDSDINDILRDAESILTRNRLRASRAAVDKSNVAGSPRAVKNNEIVQLHNDIETMIQDVSNSINISITDSSSSGLNSSITVQNEPKNCSKVNFRIINPNNTSNSPTSNNIMQTLSLPNNFTNSELNIVSTNNDSPEIGIGTPIMSNSPTNNNVLQRTPTDDSVIFVDENRHEIIDLCTPQVKNRRRNIVFDNSIIIIDDPTVDEPVPPKKAKGRNENRADLNASSSNDQAVLNCPICLEGSSRKCPTSTPCGHIFCYNCIVMAFKNANQCPLCKRKFRLNQLIKLYIT